MTTNAALLDQLFATGTIDLHRGALFHEAPEPLRSPPLIAIH